MTGPEIPTASSTSLLCSGPIETEVNTAEHFRNAIIKRVNRYFFSYGMHRELGHMTNHRNIIHGDFHLNNVLIDGMNPKIIDLENSGFGLPEVELAYFYAQLCFLIQGRAELRTELDAFIRDQVTILENVSLFWNIFTIYYRAIQLNRRFR